MGPVARGTLAIHPGALGDVLLAVPALRALRAAGPPLTLAAQRRIGAFLMVTGEVDRALDFETLGVSALFAGDGSGARVPALAGAARVVCWFGAGDATFERRLREVAPGAIVGRPSPPAAGGAPVSWPDDDRPLVWEHLRASSGVPAARPDGGERRPVGVPAALIEAGRAALRAAGWDGAAPFVLAHPGAGGAAKRWPVEGFARVLEALARSRGLIPIVHRGPADADAAGTLGDALGSGAPVLVEPSLEVLAGVLRLATLYVGNDSGVSHLAAAVGTVCVIVFTRALWPWRSWWPGARAVAADITALAPADVEAVRRAAAAALG